MVALAHPATTLLVTIDGIEATAVIDVTEGVADHHDAPTATRMPMLQVEATETASAKIDMAAPAVIVESENGIAIGVIGVIGVLGGNTAVMRPPGRLVGTVKDMETIAVVVATGETVAVEIVMRTSLRKIAVVVAPPLQRSASPHQILPTSSLSSSGSVV